MLKQFIRVVRAVAVIAMLALFVHYNALGQTDIRCSSLGYFDANNKLVAAPVVMGALVNGSRVSSDWGWRRHPFFKDHRWLFHEGVDVVAPLGSNLYALSDGVVVECGAKGSYGLYIRIRHAGGFETAYAHASKFPAGIKVGAYVKRGQVVAKVGSTGVSTGPHVHLSVYVHGLIVKPACSCKAPLLAASKSITPLVNAKQSLAR